MSDQPHSGESAVADGGVGTTSTPHDTEAFAAPTGFPVPTGPPVGSAEYLAAHYAAAMNGSAHVRSGPTVQQNPRSTVIRRPIAAAALVVVIGAVLWYPHDVRSIAVALMLAGIFAVSVWALQPHRDARIVAAVAGVAFLPWLVIRASPWLISLDLIAVLAVALHVFSRRDSIWRRSVGGYVIQWVDGFVYGAIGPWYFVRAIGGGSRETVKAAKIVKVAGIPIVVFLVVVGLLAAGDELFASYFSFLRLDTLVARIVLGFVALLLFMGAVGASSRPERRDLAADESRWSLPSAPALWTLVGLAVALSAYAATQLAAAAYGADYVTERTGLSFAEWARRGFLAMSVVAVIASTALGASSISVARHEGHRRVTQLAATVVTLGVIGVALSSIIKLSVYSDQYGLTMLRVYTLTFTGWMALVAVVQLASIWRPGGGWVTSVVLVSALVGAFAMNIANPELIVVRHNLDRVEAGVVAPDAGSCASRESCAGVFDADYALLLSEDAYPELLSRLDVLSDEGRRQVINELCLDGDERTTGLDYNYALHAAANAKTKYCR